MSRCVKYLESIDPETVNLESDYEKRSAVESNFQLAVENAIYIEEIIISEEGFERPQDYESVFIILGRHSVLPKDFAEKLVSAAEFRNVLIHMYEEIDLGVLEEFLTERLRDFEEFAGICWNILRRRKSILKKDYNLR